MEKSQSDGEEEKSLGEDEELDDTERLVENEEQGEIRMSNKTRLKI